MYKVVIGYAFLCRKSCCLEIPHVHSAAAPALRGSGAGARRDGAVEKLSGDEQCIVFVQLWAMQRARAAHCHVHVPQQHQPGAVREPTLTLLQQLRVIMRWLQHFASRWGCGAAWRCGRR